MLDPMPRSYGQRHAGNKAPCGKAEKTHIHYLTQSGSRNYFHWRTLKAHDNSNCTVRISTGFEEFDSDFKVLRPRDDSADITGKFPCGRKAGYDGKEFRIPDDMVCDNCILQFTQEINALESIH